jgi:cellulose synthase/poly-beta-1,6-N-acetylglucosamine synthase-like glycosyltransferase
VNIGTIITIIDLLLWLIIAANVAYVLFFALASLLQSKSRHPSPFPLHQSSFLVLFPAYHEDTVILHSVESFLQQDYPKDRYHVVVISDHMTSETNDQLSKLPITLLQPTFEQSSKAKALQYAIIHSPFTLHHSPYDFVVILDADNIVQFDFLTQLNEIATSDQAIQCHRTAKNADNDIAALDGISEEINNSIFRKGHNRIGMSSALIGSGMCFNYQWFAENVNHLDSAVEDRELEALLMKQDIHIHYAEDIHVMDEKVSNSDTFQRQRLRWMTGQVQALFRMLPNIPKAVITGNINYIDKTIQQALIPRSILLVLTPFLTLVSLLTFYILPLPSYIFPLKWFILLILLVAAILIAIPSPLRTRTLISKVLNLPHLVWKLTQNILYIKISSKDFFHTSHKQI